MTFAQSAAILGNTGHIWLFKVMMTLTSVTMHSTDIQTRQNILYLAPV
jgi:hypothetical protein